VGREFTSVDKDVVVIVVIGVVVEAVEINE
jgi:hypothetical protein